MPSPPPIRLRNIRNDFDRIKTLDAGDGNGPGGLNGGIYIVKRKSDGLQCVEKKFKPADARSLGRREIIQLRALSHPNICGYIDGFVMPSESSGGRDEASLYMELCDLGSLDDLIQRFKKRRPMPIVEESFVWHVFHSLLKALAYIHFGVTDGILHPTLGWSTVLHRDIKPANVFMKSPSANRLYPTIILGDFGVACKEENEPLWGSRDPVRNCGTHVWQPPEVPYHCIRGKGDVWAVGAIIMDLCRLDGGPVGKPMAGWDHQAWYQNPSARRPKTAGSRYSEALNMCHFQSLTIDRADRWTSLELLVDLKARWAAANIPFHHMPKWVFGH